MSNRLLKRKEIIETINRIDDEEVLAKIQNYLHRFEGKKVKSNKNELMKFAGILTEEEGESMKKIINEEFSKIEGEW